MWANYSTHHVHAYERISSHLLTENENRTTERMTQRKLYSVIHFMSQQHTHTIYMQTLVFFYFPPFHLSLFLSSESQSATNENFNERNAMKFKWICQPSICGQFGLMHSWLNTKWICPNMNHIDFSWLNRFHLHNLHTTIVALEPFSDTTKFNQIGDWTFASHKFYSLLFNLKIVRNKCFERFTMNEKENLLLISMNFEA